MSYFELSTDHRHWVLQFFNLCLVAIHALERTFFFVPVLCFWVALYVHTFEPTLSLRDLKDLNLAGLLPAVFVFFICFVFYDVLCKSINAPSFIKNYVIINRVG